MVKKFLNKVMAVMLGIIVVSMPTLNVSAVESDEPETQETQEAQLLSGDDGIILPPEMSYFRQYFTMYMETGSGSGEFVINQHYYDYENAHGYKPAITAVMGTNVTCDMGVTITAKDLWGDVITLDKDAYQATSFYGRAQGQALNSAYNLVSRNIWCSDDEGRGTVIYGATESMP